MKLLIELDDASTKWFKEKLSELNPSVAYEVLQADFQHIETHLPNHFEQLSPHLNALLEHEKVQSAELIAVPNITLSLLLSGRQRGVNWAGCSKKVIDPVTLLSHYLLRNNASSFLLIGSAYTSQNPVWDQIQSPLQLKREVLSSDDAAAIDALRRSIRIKSVGPNDKSRLLELLANLSSSGLRVIACSEFSQLNPTHQEMLEHRLCDLGELLAEAFTL